MERQFDDVSFKKKGQSETITVALSRFNGSNAAHTATATVSGRTLKISASVDDKNYGLQINDIDLQTGTKVERGKGQFKVLVTNTGSTSVEERYSA